MLSSIPTVFIFVSDFEVIVLSYSDKFLYSGAIENSDNFYYQ